MSISAQISPAKLGFDATAGLRQRTGGMNSPTFSNLGVSDRGGIRWLTLDRPEARNALSISLMNSLLDALEAAEADPAVKVVVMAGAGPAFCAGHDLREVRAMNDPDERRALFALCSRLMMRVAELPKCVIARVHGIATAAGCQLVASCDLAIAAEDARFATPGVNIGLFCSTPAVAVARTIGAKAAMEMLLTGEMIGAQRAVQIGLINRHVPLAQLDAEVQRLGETIAARSSAVIALGKAVFRRQMGMELADAYGHASEWMARNLEMDDAREGIGAFLEKRPPVWREQ